MQQQAINSGVHMHNLPSEKNSKGRRLEQLKSKYPAECRIFHLVNTKTTQKKNIEPMLPICRSTFLTWIKEGKLPAPIRIHGRFLVWDRDEVIKAQFPFLVDPESNGQ